MDLGTSSKGIITGTFDRSTASVPFGTSINLSLSLNVSCCSIVGTLKFDFGVARRCLGWFLTSYFTKSVVNAQVINHTKVGEHILRMASTGHSKGISNVMIISIIIFFGTFCRTRNIVIRKPFLGTDQNQHVRNTCFFITHGSVGPDRSRFDIFLLDTGPNFTGRWFNVNNIQRFNLILWSSRPSLCYRKGHSGCIRCGNFDRHGQWIRRIIDIVHINDTFSTQHSTKFIIHGLFTSG